MQLRPLPQSVSNTARAARESRPTPKSQAGRPATCSEPAPRRLLLTSNPGTRAPRKKTPTVSRTEFGDGQHRFLCAADEACPPFPAASADEIYTLRRVAALQFV